MHKGDGFQQNLLEKAYFIAKMFGSAIGPTGQFWLLESALSMYIFVILLHDWRHQFTYRKILSNRGCDKLCVGF